jgi:cytochrome b pre-mRNA-processing protein 3
MLSIPFSKRLETRVLSWFRRRAQARRRAIDFYGAIVARAREPAIFARHGVSDTPEGRTAVIILLMYPVLERLQSGGSSERRVARYLSEAFVTDIDDCLREMGVGDISVPKKVKRAAQALGQRCIAYGRAARASDPVAALAEELQTSVPGLETNRVGAEALARLTLKFAAEIGALSTDTLLSGKLALPDIADVAAPSAKS